MPVGTGNLALLQEAYTASQHGIEVLLLAPALTTTNTNGEEQSISDKTCANDELLLKTGIANRDYTNGVGTKLVCDLLQAGATVVQSLAEAVETAKSVS
jgi:hypothetical protein